MELRSKYPACDKFSKEQPELSINKELQKTLAKNFRVLPIYEKATHDHTFLKTHSLQTNEFLHCRWLEYQRIHISKKPDPYKFPNVNDYHFYNYDARYKPDQSISARQTNRYSLKIGPGVDLHGEIPIPSDVGYRKSGMMVHKGKKIVKPQLKIKKPMRRVIQKTLF